MVTGAGRWLGENCGANDRDRSRKSGIWGLIEDSRLKITGLKT